MIDKSLEKEEDSLDWDVNESNENDKIVKNSIPITPIQNIERTGNRAIELSQI